LWCGNSSIAIIRGQCIGDDDELGGEVGTDALSHRDGEDEGETDAAFAGLIRVRERVLHDLVNLFKKL
jgi:hypothetical protein